MGIDGSGAGLRRGASASPRESDERSAGAEGVEGDAARGAAAGGGAIVATGDGGGNAGESPYGLPGADADFGFAGGMGPEDDRPS
ncbi:MAG: hypothetical protein ABW133_14930, partial [Polyangiaceae bacterium]